MRTHLGGLNQDASQFARRWVGEDPHIVGPFEPQPQSPLGVQGLGHRHTHHQRECSPALRPEREAQGHHQALARLAVPLAAQAPPARGLVFGHQQRGPDFGLARTAHEFGVGGVDLAHHLHAKTRPLGCQLLPQVFGRPAQLHAHGLSLQLAWGLCLPLFLLLPLPLPLRLDLAGLDSASMVPRQDRAPHQHGYSARSFSVMGPSSTRP